MLNINLLPDKNSLIYISQTPTTANKVYDIISVVHNKDSIPHNVSRKPWEYLCESIVYETVYGPDYKGYNTVSMRTIGHYSQKHLLSMYKQSFSIAIIQNDNLSRNDGNTEKRLACICNDCYIDRSRNDFRNLDITFRVSKTEMIYE